MNRAPRSSRVAAPLLGAGVLAATALAGECLVYSPMILFADGEPAPGTGQNWAAFDRPNLSSSGVVAWGGNLDGDSTLADIVAVDGVVVAREGDPAPGSKGGAYSSFEFFETAHQVNASGDVAYIATLRDVPSTENRAVYLNDVLVAQEGQQAPGIPGVLIEDFGFAGVTDDGRVGYLATLDADSSADSLVVLGGAAIYREGDPVPGLPGIVFDGNFDEIQWNGAGDLILEGNTSLSGDDMVVLLRRDLGGSIEETIVAQEGQLIEASGGDDFLELILQNALAENGDWALRGNLGIAPSDSDAIIISGLGFQAQQGDAVPELPGVVLGNFNAVHTNSNGQVLYLADLEGATPAGVDEGLFVNGCLIITDGVQAPGLPDGVTLTDIGFEDCYINDAGQIAFVGNYTGGDGIFFVEAPGGDPCPADIDASGDVGFNDLVIMLGSWGACPIGEPCPADLNSSGDVTLQDLLILLSNWGPCP